jgi:hypothetical protein
MLEPRYTVSLLAQLLQLSEATVRRRIEAREFGRYYQGRSGLEVSLRGLQSFLRSMSDGQVSSVQPFYSPRFLAAVYGTTKQRVQDRIEAGEFGPCLRLSTSREWRVPLAGLIHYDQAHGVGSAA